MKVEIANPIYDVVFYAEDEVFDYMKMLERMAAYKAANEERKKWEADLAKKDEELVKKDEELQALRLKLQMAGLL